MPQPVLRVEGARQLRSAMKRAGADLGDLTTANREAAGVIAPVAVGAAPRRTGRLAGTLRIGATKTQAVIRAGNAAVPYAGVIHWGWPKRHIHAQPWVSEAAQSTEPAWLPVYVRTIQQIIDRIGASTP